MKLRNYRIMNMDVTLILQKPRVAKYKPAMKVRRSPPPRPRWRWLFHASGWVRGATR